MFQVEKIILQFGTHFVVIVGVALVYLRPAGNTGTNDAAQREVWDLPYILLVERGRFRPRTDPAHVAAQNVEQLGQFVESATPQEVARARHPGIARLGEARPVRAMEHRAELDHAEGAPAPADPRLQEEDRPWTVEPHGNGDQAEDRHQQRKA